MAKGSTPLVCGAEQDAAPYFCQSKPVLVVYVPEAEVERLREALKNVTDAIPKYARDASAAKARRIALDALIWPAWSNAL